MILLRWICPCNPAEMAYNSAVYFCYVTSCHYLSELQCSPTDLRFQVCACMCMCSVRIKLHNISKSTYNRMFSVGPIFLFINTKIKIISHLIIKFCFLTFHLPLFQEKWHFWPESSTSVSPVSIMVYICRHGLYRNML